MEKSTEYLEILEPALQALAMRITCEHLGTVIPTDEPLLNYCDEIDILGLIMAFEEEFDSELFEDEERAAMLEALNTVENIEDFKVHLTEKEQSIKTLDDLIELIRIRFPEEELKERIGAIFARSMQARDDEEEEFDDDEPASEDGTFPALDEDTSGR